MKAAQLKDHEVIWFDKRRLVFISKSYCHKCLNRRQRVVYPILFSSKLKFLWEVLILKETLNIDPGFI